MSFLGSFLFTYEQACGPVGNLSGGERSRLQMALLMLSGANLLLLDEPTNNLDIASAGVLEPRPFRGAPCYYFLDRVVGGWWARRACSPSTWQVLGHSLARARRPYLPARHCLGRSGGRCTMQGGIWRSGARTGHTSAFPHRKPPARRSSR